MRGKVGMTNQNNTTAKKQSSFPIVAVFYGLISLAYVLYSYTQIDLGLSISSSGFVASIQRQFQEIGYFNRPVSTVLFISILVSLFILYGFVLFASYRKQLRMRDFWICIGVISIITLVAYPALSYDFFNYLFTAKTVLVYHKNPYVVIPLQFAGVDPWLSFMHWTHLPSAYTPLWITSTFIPYIFGFGKLGLLIINLKLYITLAYIATTIGIGKILSEKSEHASIVGMSIFALNPLVITECLISPHNDIVMMALIVWAIVAFKKSRPWVSWLLFSLSVAMKLMTLALFPVFFLKWDKKIAVCCMILALGAVITQREVLSWYWIWVIPFVALLPEYPSITMLSAGVSIGLLLRYVPFLYLGNWDAPAPTIKIWVTLVPILLSIIGTLLIEFKKKRLRPYVIRS